MAKSEQKYNPIMFLSSLWAGWLSVSFFMYLMFILPRDEKYPIPTFNTILANWNEWNIFFQALIIFSVLGILFFAFKHIKLLIWNLKEYFAFKKTKEYENMLNSTSEINLMAIPLTLAMTINVLFVLWAISIPNLFDFIEYLLPFALIWFTLVWILGLKIFSDYFIKLITKKTDADFVNTNNLSQMLSVFAFSMIWVWFASPAFISQNELSVFLWIVWSIFFSVIALFLLILKIIIWFKSIFEKWLDRATSPSLWIIIPILTILWITFLRQVHGLDTFWWNTANSTLIAFTTIIISLQIIFWYIGYRVMKENWYFKDFIDWKEKNPWSYALICPWVALTVFWFFFIHIWMVWAWILEKFSIMYFIILIPVVYLQIKTIIVLFKLNKKFSL